MAESLHDRVRALVEEGAGERAITLLQDALSRAEGDDPASIWRMTAYVHLRMNNLQRGVEAASQGLREVPANPALLFVRALTYVDLHEFLLAMDDLVQLVDLEVKADSTWHL